MLFVVGVAIMLGVILDRWLEYPASTILIIIARILIQHRRMFIRVGIQNCPRNVMIFQTRLVLLENDDADRHWRSNELTEGR